LKEALSAGGVVLGPSGRVVLVSQKDKSWSLPKGHRERGEDGISAARREIYEESGILELELVGNLGRYQRFRRGISENRPGAEFKTIEIWLFVTKQEQLQPLDPDNLEAIWIPIDAVTDLLSYPEDRDFFQRSIAVIKQAAIEWRLGKG
jgi:ADP-ribose pyrophosphatase YjhB (NUDIX family)